MSTKNSHSSNQKVKLAMSVPLALFLLPFVFLLVFTSALTQAACENGSCMNGNVCTKRFTFDENGQNWQKNKMKLELAVEEAKRFFRDKKCDLPNLKSTTSLPGYRFRILLPAGRFPVNPLTLYGINTDKGDDSRVGDTQNWLQFLGRGMLETTLVFPRGISASPGVYVPSIAGTKVNGVLWQDIHFTKDRLMVTQGIVEKAYRNVNDETVLRLLIDDGFPHLDHISNGGIFDRYNPHGRYIMKFVGNTYKRLSNHDGGYPWLRASRSGTNNRLWNIVLDNDTDRKALSFFSEGSKIGIKSKHGGQAYRFLDGSRIAFKRVRWTRATRGVFRGVDNVTIESSIANRDSCIDVYTGPSLRATDCVKRRFSYLASHSGGPQIGNPADNPFNPKFAHITNGGDNHRIYNNRFIALGDDPIGLFHLKSRSTVTNNFISDGVARDIYHLDACGYYARAAHVALNGCNNCVRRQYYKIKRHHGDRLSNFDYTQRCEWWNREMAQ